MKQHFINLIRKEIVMDRQNFINLLGHRGVNIIPHDGPIFDRCMYMNFQETKTFFKYVDFNCQIHKDGSCKEFQLKNNCCCHNCYQNAGFLKRMVDLDITKYSRVFSVKTGFWREDKGCMLPHKLRSTTCLTTHCNYEKGDRGFSIAMLTLKNKIKEYGSKI
jgi:hypothetical protein